MGVDRHPRWRCGRVPHLQEDEGIVNDVDGDNDRNRHAHIVRRMVGRLQWRHSSDRIVNDIAISRAAHR
jgi:hypothetical protein